MVSACGVPESTIPQYDIVIVNHQSSITNTDHLSSMPMEHQIVTHRSRCRQQSPHPVDIMKGQVSLSKGIPQKSNGDRQVVKICNQILPDTKQQQHHYYSSSHISTVDAYEEVIGDHNTIPDFTLSDNLESTESAQELRHLIDAMKSEFLRLRNSKLQAEDRADRLQTDLIQQQQKSEKLSEVLRTENEHLKAVANAKDKKLEQAMKTIHQLENEIQTLKIIKERRKKHDRDRDRGGSVLGGRAQEDDNAMKTNTE